MNIKFKKYFILLIAVLAVLGASAQSTTFTGNTSEDWFTSGNWSNGVPDNTKDAIITGGESPEISSGSATCKSLTIGGDNKSNSLTMSGGTLTITNALSFGAPTAGNKTNFLELDNASLTCGSITMAATSNNNRVCSIEKNGTGTITVNGNITFGSNSPRNVITLTEGTLKISGNVTGGNSGCLAISSGQTVEYFGGSAQTMFATTYSKLNLYGSSVKSMGGSFTINSTCSIASGSQLNINGNTLTLASTSSLTGSGTVRGSSTSNLSITSTTTPIALNMDQTSSSTRTLQNLTYNASSKTLNISNALEVTGTVTVTAGTVASAGNLTLVSTASGDARVAQSSGSITGNVIVQKYIAAGTVRRWLQMASPVSGFTWNELMDDIYVTGQNGQGFDANQTKLSSIFTYSESVAGDSYENGWVEGSAPSNSVAASKGMKVFYRGDRSDPTRLNLNNPPLPNAATIDFVGAINSGTQNMGVTYTNNGNASWDGWNFVSNPYPSAIDWNSASGWTKTNMSGTIYVWNAESGVYATWNGSSGTNGMSNGRIAMGQGFWVKATTTSPVLSMTEAVKTSSAATGFFKMATTPVNSFRISMVQNELIRDELMFNFDQSFDRVFDKSSGDALKLFNTSLNIWAKTTDGENLVINNYPSSITVDTITLGMTSKGGGIFTLEFSNDSLPSDLSVFLIDSYRGRTIDVRKEKTWKVLINEDAASYAEGRLKLVFISQQTTALNLNAALDNNTRTVGISWNSNQEMNTASYEVEHSTDGEVFTKVGEVLVGDTLIIGQSNYQFTHQKPATGANYYRIKRIAQNGFTQFTNMAQVELVPQLNAGVQGASVSFKVYPNPAIHTLTVSLNDVSGIEGSMLEIINMKGVCVYSEIISTSGKDFDSQIQVEKLPAGVYTLLISGNKKLYRELFVKQ